MLVSDWKIDTILPCARMTVSLEATPHAVAPPTSTELPAGSLSILPALTAFRGRVADPLNRVIGIASSA
jgi:hypothetical protein